MYIIPCTRPFFLVILSYLTACSSIFHKNGRSGLLKLGSHGGRLLFLGSPSGLSQVGKVKVFGEDKGNSEAPVSKNLESKLQGENSSLEDEVESVLYRMDDPDCLRGPFISRDGKVVNKRKHLYSTGELCHVDDFFQGKFRVEWTVRGVKEKLQYRYREMHSLPLRTSRFSFGGVKGFVLKLWLDGLRNSKEGHFAMNLVQQERWSSLDSPICLFAGNVVKGPFFYRSPEYFSACKSFCPLEDVVENNTLKLGVMISKR